jgi:DnaJ like chaperone protein
MFVRLILGLIVSWLIMTVVRAAVQAAVPSKSRSRRGRAPATKSQRRQALAALGLYDGAKAADIKRAYKELATKYHPDRVAHLGPELVELTTEKFKQINAAYAFLTGK